MLSTPNPGTCTVLRSGQGQRYFPLKVNGTSFMREPRPGLNYVDARGLELLYNGHFVRIWGDTRGSYHLHRSLRVS